MQISKKLKGAAQHSYSKKNFGVCDCAELGLSRVMVLVIIAVVPLMSAQTIFSPSRAPKAYMNDDGSNYILRLSYGVTAKRIKQVCVVEGYWHQILHVELPSRQPETPLPPVCQQSGGNTTKCSPDCDEECKRIQDLYEAVAALTITTRQSIRNLIDNIYQWVPDLNTVPAGVRQPNPRRGRAPFSGIGTASRWLFGTATIDDVDSLKEAMKLVQDNVQIAAADAARTREGLASYTKLQNDRMDRFHEAIREQQTSINHVMDAVITTRAETSMELKAITLLATEMRRFVSLHDQIQELAQGVDQLIYGQLSPKLINTNQLRALLTDINNQLSKDGKRLCHTTPREVFMSQNFDVARAQNDLIIKLSMPYARHRLVDVYQTTIFAMTVPGKQGFITTLQGFPRYIIRDQNTHLWGQITDLPMTNLLDAFDVKWIRSTSTPCTHSILKDEAEKARDQCTFIIKQEVIPSSLLRLTTGMYVASNLTKITVSCDDRISEPTTELCAPCVIHLDCNCTLMDHGRIVQKEIQGCHWDGPAGVSVMHPVNLALLQQFYDTGNENLSTQLLLDPSQVKRPVDLNLPFFGSNISQILAADKTDGYILSKVAESLKNNSVIYHSPSEALLNDVIRVMNRPPSFFSFDSNLILVTGAYVAIGLLAFMGFRLHQRVAAVTMFMTSRVHGYELKNAFMNTTPNPVTPRDVSRLINDLLSEVRHIDMAYMTIMIIITIVTSLGMTLAIKRALGRYSYLYLEIIAGNQSHQLRFATLPDASRNTVVRIPRAELKVQLTNYYLFGVLTLTPRAPKTVNTLNGQRTQLRNFTFIAPWTVTKINQLTTMGEYTIIPLIVNTHEYTFMDQNQVSPTAPMMV